MRTVTDVSFRSDALNVVQPNLFFPDAILVNIHLPSDVSESKRVANDSYGSISESIITHGSPPAVRPMMHFKTSFAWTSASKQCYCAIC